jgi:hypothetical protein
MEHCWNNNSDRRKRKYSEKKNLFQCHIIHHKSHVDSPRLRGKRLATILLNFEWLPY